MNDESVPVRTGLSRRRVLSTLSVAAAGTAAGLITTARPAAAAVVATGLDYSWARPRPSVIKSSGYSFVCRYVSLDTTGKNLTASEAQSLTSAGLSIVLVWEQAANAALNGYSQGVSDAQEAARQAAACGMPSGRPLYFAVDFDASASQQSAINSYFDGVASVIGRSRTGAYAGYYPIKRLFDAGKITWGWQTYAWSGGQWDSRAQLRQVQNGITVDGGDCDLDNAMTSDYGQWPGGGGGAAATKVEIMASTSSALYQATGDYGAGRWSGWGNVTAATGGGAGASYMAGTMTGNTLDLYIANSDPNHIWNTGGNFDAGLWSSWQDVCASGAAGPVGGSVTQLVAATRGTSKVELLALVNGKIMQSSADYAAGTWTKWADLTAANGGGSFTQITAICTGNTLHVYGVDNDANHVWNADGNYDTGTWTGWFDLVPTVGSIGQVSQLTTAKIGNRVHLAALVGGKILEVTGDYGAGYWTQWGDVTAANGGGSFTQIVATTTGNTLHIYGLQADPGTIWNADGNYDTGTWSGWMNVTGATGSIGNITKLVATSH